MTVTTWESCNLSLPCSLSKCLPYMCPSLWKNMGDIQEGIYSQRKSKPQRLFNSIFSSINQECDSNRPFHQWVLLDSMEITPIRWMEAVNPRKTFGESINPKGRALRAALHAGSAHPGAPGTEAWLPGLAPAGLAYYMLQWDTSDAFLPAPLLHSNDILCKKPRYLQSSKTAQIAHTFLQAALAGLCHLL